MAGADSVRVESRLRLLLGLGLGLGLGWLVPRRKKQHTTSRPSAPLGIEPKYQYI